MFGHIGCCVDGSPADEIAISLALELRAEGTRLSMIHVAPRSLSGGNAPGERARGHTGGQPVTLAGVPGPAICDWAAEAGADLVVMATHRGRSGAAVLGQSTGYVFDHAPCAVTVVRGPAVPAEAVAATA